VRVAAARVPGGMSNIEEGRQDVNSAMPDDAGPPASERKRPAWMMIALLAALAIVAAVIILTVIPNGVVNN